jgi:Flp pilus assembly protein TadD
MRNVSWETAEQHFLRAWELEPTNPRHAMELGALYTDSGRPELAREVLRQAVTIPVRAPADSLVVFRATVLLAEVERRDGGA